MKKTFAQSVQNIFSENNNKIITRKEITMKEITKIHKKERHKRKTSTNVYLQNDCCFVTLWLRDYSYVKLSRPSGASESRVCCGESRTIFRSRQSTVICLDQAQACICLHTRLGLVCFIQAQPCDLPPHQARFDLP